MVCSSDSPGGNPGPSAGTAAPRKLTLGQFSLMIETLRREGYRVIGPTLRASAVAYEEIRSLEDLPAGWSDQQEAGSYRLWQRPDKALFGHHAGQDSWKRWLHVPMVRLWQARRKAGRFTLTELPEEDPAPLAFLGVRPCDLAAIRIQDAILTGGPYVDPLYRARRERAMLIGVNCTEPCGTCFCASMKTGPDVQEGFDLALTEMPKEEAGETHTFIAQCGSPRGEELLGRVGARPASDEEQEAARRLVAQAAGQMGRTLRTDDLRELLQDNFDHPRWEAVARRCLTCGNCTMVCPTCFCTTVEDSTDLTGGEATRRRVWDVCYTLDFTYLYGGHVRETAKSRYRQWLTHKLSTWIDQFGVSGCVGCGRCITWCPVGIDLTEEVTAIRQTSLSAKG